MKVTVEGRKQLAAKLKKANRDVESRVHRAVAEVGEALLAEAMPGVPLEHGELRQSGYVEHSPGEAVVGFGASYAVYVHEMPPAPETNWTPPGTNSKYLTAPFLLNRERYKAHIVKAAKEALR